MFFLYNFWYENKNKNLNFEIMASLALANLRLNLFNLNYYSLVNNLIIDLQESFQLLVSL